jgi:hypothetical protein
MQSRTNCFILEAFYGIVDCTCLGWGTKWIFILWQVRLHTKHVGFCYHLFCIYLLIKKITEGYCKLFISFLIKDGKLDWIRKTLFFSVMISTSFLEMRRKLLHSSESVSSWEIRSSLHKHCIAQYIQHSV